MKKKRLMAAISAIAVAITMFMGCGSSNNSAKSGDSATKENYNVSMVTDTGGVNDQSFNQSSWEGLQQLSKDVKDKNVKVSYLESKQESDYATNLDKAADSGCKLIWGVGYAMADALTNAAKKNPDVNYAIIDNSYGKDTLSNVTGVMFKAEESSFMVGYIAGKTTKTGKVGFVGGQTSAVIDEFEYGYKAGAQYAAKELGKTIEVQSQYAQSYNDAAKGKAIANSMFSKGCDIVFHAAGGTGVGVIEAAKEANKFAIGVDRDQAYLAPKNVLTSALKNVNVAVEKLSKDAMSGKKIGGQTFTYGLKEGAVGIPEKNDNLDKKVYDDTMKIQDEIKAGKITPPASKDSYEKFVKDLK